MLLNSASGAGFATRAAGAARVSVVVREDTPVRVDETELAAVEGVPGMRTLPVLLLVLARVCSKYSSGMGTQSLEQWKDPFLRLARTVRKSGIAIPS
jgi:hypothetical protein